MTEDYTDLQIRILSKGVESGAYRVEPEINGIPSPGDVMHMEGEDLLVKGLDADQYGTALANSLFSGQIFGALFKAIGRAESETDSRLRFRLWIDEEVSELHAIPWERLYHPNANIPLAISAQTPFSRFAPSGVTQGDILTKRPVQMLFVIANPYNLPQGFAPIDMEAEVRNLREIVSEFETGDIKVSVMPGRTKLSPLTKKDLTGDGIEIIEGHTTEENLIREMGKHHIIHFLGHGAFKIDGGGTAFLYLENPDGGWKAVTDDALSRNVAALHPRPHLIFLAACESATQTASEHGHPFVGLGPKLVQAGIPAVVAMQARVDMELARQLTFDFYRQLLDHGLVDVALNQARNLLFSSKHVEWSIPVLFMRLEDGRLFDAGADPIAPTIDKAKIDVTSVNLPQLTREINNSFNLDEIRELCFDLNIDFEDLAGSTRSAKSRELVLFCQRRGRLPELLTLLARQRPNVDW